MHYLVTTLERNIQDALPNHEFVTLCDVVTSRVDRSNVTFQVECCGPVDPSSLLPASSLQGRQAELELEYLNI